MLDGDHMIDFMPGRSSARQAIGNIRRRELPVPRRGDAAHWIRKSLTSFLLGCGQCARFEHHDEMLNLFVLGQLLLLCRAEVIVPVLFR